MLKRLFTVAVAILLFAQVPGLWADSDPEDREGSKDPSIFNRMPGYHIGSYTEEEFGRYEFPASPGKVAAVEGRSFFVVYYPNEGIKYPSGLQITRNYLNAAIAAGGKKVYEFNDGGTQNIVVKITKGDTEIWAHVLGSGGGAQYDVHIIEKQVMRQDVVADASSLAASINDTGKASVYGIYFDTGKAEIKPESEPALQEIAKMLKSSLKMKLYVVGHTDNVGTFDSNVALSNSRAAAVVKALATKYSIPVARLQPFGAGPTSPVQTNQTEEGRAKNRRVELVAQ